MLIRFVDTLDVFILKRICYSAISNYTAVFYSVDFSSVNFLSLVFLIIAIPVGLISVVVIDYFGIRLSLNIAGLFIYNNFLFCCSSFFDVYKVGLILLVHYCVFLVQFIKVMVHH